MNRILNRGARWMAPLMILLWLTACGTTVEKQQNRYKRNMDKVEALLAKHPHMRPAVAAKLQGFDAEYQQIMSGAADKKVELARLNSRIDTYVGSLDPTLNNRPGTAAGGTGKLHQGAPVKGGTVGKPGMGAGQMGKPGMGKPGMGKPGMGQPGMAKPGMAKPGMAKPGMAKPGMGAGQMGKPGMAQPGMAKPGMAQPGMGAKPGMAKPGMGTTPAGMGAKPGVQPAGIGAKPGMAKPGMGTKPAGMGAKPAPAKAPAAGSQPGK
ncbi:MAG: hypothetical protein ACE366_31140 [Bradymonadia bacterium]